MALSVFLSVFAQGVVFTQRLKKNADNPVADVFCAAVRLGSKWLIFKGKVELCWALH